ncbi:hypothetical protein [Micromonospora mirobrigensis]|nr:hypothetical protein [Micromonospora mirobrigensis]
MPLPRRTVTALATLLAAAVGGCTSGTAPTAPPAGAAPSPRPATAATSAATAPAEAGRPRLSVPATLPGEIARVVYTGGANAGMSGTSHRETRAGTEYLVRAACVADEPSRTVHYQLAGTSGEEPPLAGGDVPCDGEETTTSMPLPATRVQITLEASGGSDLADVSSAYAILVPAG